MMSEQEDPERKGFLNMLRPRSGKVERPAPDERDSLGNRIAPPQVEKRKKLKAITQWVEPEVAQQIKLIAVEQGKQQQEIINEALNMVFARYHKGEIA